MQMLVNMLAALLPLAYGLASVNYLVYFVRHDPFAERTCTRFLSSTFALHLLYLLLRVFLFERFSIVGLAELLTVIAVAIAGVYLYVERIQRDKHTGAFIIPMVVLLQLMATTLMPEVVTPKSELLSSSLFGIHTVVAVLGYSAFLVGAAYGVMYLLLYRSLKKKRFGLVFDRLPSLDQLADMGFWATFLGWIFLTATIALGVVMSLQAFPDFYRDPKFLATVGVWVVYGASVAAHFVLGWRGERSVYMSLTGFAFAVVSMVASEYIWQSFHTFEA